MSLNDPQELDPIPAGVSLTRLKDFVGENSVALTVLAGAFVARWLLSGWNSYWLDELYAVAVNGIWQESAMGAVRRVAESVHPPLYQLILYYWMVALGDGEVATRTLSNLYVAVGGWFVYLLARDAFSKRVAVWSVVVFTLLFSVTYYGLETRPYAQTIVLVALSSYLFLKVTRRGLTSGWREAIWSPSGTLLIVINTAVLLTHYYNVFFWAAQALFAAVIAMREFPPRKWLVALGAVTLAYVVQVGLFAAIWGWAVIETVRREAGRIEITDASELLGPLTLLRESVLLQNLSAPTWVLWIGALAMSVLLIRAVAVFVTGQPSGQRYQAYARLYVVAWMVLPLLLVYAGFLTLGVAKYSTRYFVFSTIPLATLLVLSVDEVSEQVARMLRRRSRVDNLFWLFPALCAVMVVSVVLPGTVRAATSLKADWRGGAQEVVGVVEADPQSSYIVYETAFRSTSVLDYYLARYSDTLRVSGTIQRLEERRGYDFRFQLDEDKIDEYDYLIVTFIHHRTSNFPIALKLLEERYEVHHRHLNRRGHGYIVFDVEAGGHEP